MAATQKFQSVKASEITDDHAGRIVMFFYQGSHSKPVKRLGRVNYATGSIINLHFPGEAPEYKSFDKSQIFKGIVSLEVETVHNV